VVVKIVGDYYHYVIITTCNAYLSHAQQQTDGITIASASEAITDEPLKYSFYIKTPTNVLLPHLVFLQCRLIKMTNEL
jgi:hypothetical protein